MIGSVDRTRLSINMLGVAGAISASNIICIQTDRSHFDFQTFPPPLSFV